MAAEIQNHPNYQAAKLGTRDALREAGGTQGGGGMDDLLKRVGNLEVAMSGVREDVAFIKATLPHLTTKVDISALEVKIANAETSIIKWVVATAIACAALAFAAAKLIQ